MLIKGTKISICNHYDFLCDADRDKGVQRSPKRRFCDVICLFYGHALGPSLKLNKQSLPAFIHLGKPHNNLPDHRANYLFKGCKILFLKFKGPLQGKDPSHFSFPTWESSLVFTQLTRASVSCKRIVFWLYGFVSW